MRDLSAYNGRGVLRRLLHGRHLGMDGRPHKLARCGHWSLGNRQLVLGSDGRARMTGVETCGDWRRCPVCRVRTMSTMGAEIGAVAWRWLQDPERSAVLVTIAPCHRAGDLLLDVLWRFEEALAQVLDSQKPFWRNFKKRLGVHDYCSVVEVTVSERSGWHPHAHLVLLLDRPWTAEDADCAQARLWQRMDAELRSTGFAGTFSPDAGVDIQQVDDPAQLGRYLSKWAIGAEVADAGTKDGRSEGALAAHALPAAIGEMTSRPRGRQYQTNPRVRWLVDRCDEFVEATEGGRRHWYRPFRKARRICLDLAPSDGTWGDRWRAAVAVLPVDLRPDMPAVEGADDDPFDASDVLVPDHLAWTAALARWHAPRAPDGPAWLRRYGRWYSASGRHVRAPLELVLGWVAEDEGMATAARALAELAGGAAVDSWARRRMVPAVEVDSGGVPSGDAWAA